jgi:hypothetical protein
MTKFTDRPESPEDILFATEGGMFFVDEDDIVEYGPLADLPPSAVFAGTLNEDGIKEAISQSTTTHVGWQGGRAYKTTVDSADVTIDATALEYNEAVANKYLDEAINSVTGGRHVNALKLGKKFQLLIIAQDADNGKQIRQWFPSVQVTKKGDRQFNGTTASGFPITITAYPKVIEGVTTHFVEWKEDEVVAS